MQPSFFTDINARRILAGKLHSRSAVSIIILVVAALSPAATTQSKSSAEPATVHVDATPGHEINSFDPDSALGSSIDVLSHTDIDKVYTPHIIQESLSAGWGPITYRNNSELRMAAWHWTENGTWSDPAHQSGYFTGSTDLTEPVRYILSYALPHRGFSTSGDRPLQGPNLSHWKSNPYLTSKFTGESDALHPQWVVVDLKAERPVNAIRIAWASPYATTYQVQYWVGTRALDFDGGPQGEWKTFLSGAIRNAPGGTANLKLADAPVSTQYLRILMTESSNTCDLHGRADSRCQSWRMNRRTTIQDCFQIAKHRAGNSIALKVCKAGGMTQTKKVAAIAEAAGIGLYGGTMIESSLGTAICAQLYATIPEMKFGTELFGPLLFKDTITVNDIQYENFEIIIPDGVGFGVGEIDKEKVQHYSREI